MKNNKLVSKIIVVTVILTLIAAFRYFNFGQYLTLSSIKTYRVTLLTLYAKNRFIVIASYMAIYVLITSLSLPGAMVLTLVSGTLFGFFIGTVVVSFASAIGATLACIVSRFVLRDWIQGKFGDKLSTVNEGIRQEGSFYLFTIRLIPIFPFFVINLVMGLTRMPIFTFFWVSQVGMLPGTMVFVNAGKELAKIDSLSGILSPSFIFSFALLGLVPIATKKIMSFYKARSERTT